MIELEHKAEDPVSQFITGGCGQVVDPVLLQANFPGVGRIKQTEQVHQRALATARLADDRHKLAASDTQIDPSQNRNLRRPFRIGLTERH